MVKIKANATSLFQALGAFGTLICIIVFIRQPSFPTPDKLMVFLLFVFMASRQTLAMLLRLGPFALYILLYEVFRGLARHFNGHVNYTLAPHFDKAVFGKLPTVTLQNWLWDGHVRWYDYVIYIPYTLYFVLPFALAILIWKTRPDKYLFFLMAYFLTYFGGLVTYIIFPAAPPWLASQQHVIEPIRRISSDVWSSLGIQDFPSLYSHFIASNDTAAVPSLHAACSTLFSLLIFKLYGRRWGAVSLIYPLLIYVGVIYQGEHYAFDVITGIIYAIVAFKLTPWAMHQVGRFWRWLKSHFKWLNHHLHRSTMKA